MTGFESRITSNISWHLGLKEDAHHRADDIDSNSIMFIKKKKKKSIFLQNIHFLHSYIIRFDLSTYYPKRNNFSSYPQTFQLIAYLNYFNF